MPDDVAEMTRKPRTIVLCFDGTSNEYSDNNTNVVKFFSLLKKENFDEQLCYYQPGIGTWFDPGVVAPIFEWGAKVLDEALAMYLDAHVIDGYRYIMQNYHAGDKICLFGFSRGSYTARALAGALYAVGLLSKDNEQQISFAYKLYKREDKEGIALCAGFKRTFCRDVKIEFVGVWDTVQSTGVVMGRSLPFTNSNTAIKTFRHAMSLDERRARFRPNLYQRPSPIEGPAVSDPERGGPATDPVEEGDQTDVLEVWFAGWHGDVGGSCVPDAVKHQLSNISLRWMVREVMKSQCGIQFDEHVLARESIPEFNFLKPADANGKQKALDTSDALEPMYNQLQRNWMWWLLEIVPMHYSWQDEKGVWHTEYNCHFGRGRKIPTPNPLFHTSVKERMADPKLKYKPKAQWTAGTEVYVD